MGVLDFTLLPTIDSMSIFSTLPKSLDDRLRGAVGFEEFHERAKSALMFFAQLSHENEVWRNAASLRAGLNEFYSLNDALRRVFKKNGLNKKSPYSWEEHPNPLFQLMSILRGVWVHVAVTSSASRAIEVISRFASSAEEAHSINVVILCSDTKNAFLDSGVFKPKKNGKSIAVDKAEFEMAMDWLLEQQGVFGIAHLFKTGVEMYCEEALKLFNPPLV